MAGLGTLGIYGLGRFGAALGELAAEAGYSLRAWDPMCEVPNALAVSSPADLARASDIIVLAMPVEHTAESIRQLAPYLESSQLVLDVGSVKVAPAAAMREGLTDRVAWVASHPLFGPTSLSRGERPLRVVLCDSGLDGLARGREFWTSLGCDCLEQSAEEHDRAMARSHALAFFLAKGLVEVGAGEGAAFSPPSFDAMRQTIGAVRSDAGHLFRSIQNRNPFAAEERERLLAALRRIDRDLHAPAEEPSEDMVVHDALSSDPSTETPTVDLLDEIDRELVSLLARRRRIASRQGSTLPRGASPGLADTARSLGVSDETLQLLRSLLEEL